MSYKFVTACATPGPKRILITTVYHLSINSEMWTY